MEKGSEFTTIIELAKGFITKKSNASIFSSLEMFMGHAILHKKRNLPNLLAHPELL
jgi:hypothetical protein